MQIKQVKNIWLEWNSTLVRKKPLPLPSKRWPSGTIIDLSAKCHQGRRNPCGGQGALPTFGRDISKTFFPNTMVLICLGNPQQSFIRIHKILIYVHTSFSSCNKKICGVMVRRPAFHTGIQGSVPLTDSVAFFLDFLAFFLIFF